MANCKKHNRPLIQSDDTLNLQCYLCIQVEKRKYNDEMKKCNWVIEVVNTPLVNGFYSEKMLAMKFKPHMKLSKGSYAVLNPKTGYLERAKGPYVQFYVVQ